MPGFGFGGLKCNRQVDLSFNSLMEQVKYVITKKEQIIYVITTEE